MDKIEKSDAEWREQLTDEQYYVTRQKGTERPFTGEYYKHDEEGIYTCVVCNAELFKSETKYDHGCGWPSFSKPVDETYINELRDTGLGMIRTEVRSTHGDSHLGHVFTDGPLERGGLRYCINSASLRFIPVEEMETEGYGDYINQVEEG